MIGHETDRTENDGEFLKWILAYFRSSLIYLPWVIEKLLGKWVTLCFKGYLLFGGSCWAEDMIALLWEANTLTIKARLQGLAALPAAEVERLHARYDDMLDTATQRNPLRAPSLGTKRRVKQCPRPTTSSTASARSATTCCAVSPTCACRSTTTSIPS
jgi:hypothetical protein